jgi:hypothetical protein
MLDALGKSYDPEITSPLNVDAEVADGDAAIKPAMIASLTSLMQTPHPQNTSDLDAP